MLGLLGDFGKSRRSRRRWRRRQQQQRRGPGYDKLIKKRDRLQRKLQKVNEKLQRMGPLQPPPHGHPGFPGFPGPKPAPLQKAPPKARPKIAPPKAAPPKPKRVRTQADKERDYLKKYPDVAGAVRARTFKSGHQHWLKHGKREGRVFAGFQRPGYLAGIFSNWDQ